jgi:hypothetical protein
VSNLILLWISKILQTKSSWILHVKFHWFLSVLTEHLGLELFCIVSNNDAEYRYFVGSGLLDILLFDC